MRLIDADALRESVLKWLPHDPCGVEENERPHETDICVSMLMEIEDAPTIEPTAQPELTDEQAIAHLQSSGWMQRHDKEMYESGLKEQLADDSDSYDGLLQTVQPKPHEGHWIPHEYPDGDVQYECSECGVLWEFNDGTPEDNEAYFCPKCGADMRGGDE